MKRILSLLLAIIMVLSLAACKDETTKPSNDSTKPTQSGTVEADPTKDATTDDTQPESTDSPTTEPAEDTFVWETKTMSAPTVAELDPTIITLNTTDGQSFQSTLINPSIQCDFSDDMKEKIKAYPLFDGWVFADIAEESGAPVSYSNIDGLRYTYEYEEIFAAKHAEDASDIYSDFTDFKVYRSWETKNAANFNNLTMFIALRDDMINENAQEDILNLLKIVFGDEIGEYLCYSDMTDRYGELCRVKQDASEVIFSRYVEQQTDRCYLTFSVYTQNTGTTYDCISCDYTPVANFSHLNALLGDELQFDPMKYDIFGESVMSKHFNGYLGMETSSNGLNGYVYKYTKAENGFTEKEFTLDGDILQKDVFKIFAPELRVYLLNKYQDDALIYTNGDLRFITGPSDETDQDKLHQMFDSHVFAIMEALIAGDQQVAANMKSNDYGNFDTYTTNITVMDKEVEANFNYKLSEDANGRYKGFSTIRWDKDLR